MKPFVPPKLAPPDRKFLVRIAARMKVDVDYALHVIAGEPGVKDGRLVALSMTSFVGESLDVSGLDALRRLQVRGGLRKLTLGKHLFLGHLDLADTKLEALDLSGCPGLATLKLSRTNLTALPVLPKRLRELDCDHLALGSLALTSTVLESLVVSGCGLAALDVAGLPALRRLECASNHLAEVDVHELAKLEALECQDNGAESIALPGLAPIKSLALGHNPLAAFDAGRFPELETLLVGGMGLRTLTLRNPKLEHLDCSENPLESLELSSARALKILNVRGTKLASLDLQPLGKLCQLEIDPQIDVRCTEKQKQVPGLQSRFDLSFDRSPATRKKGKC